MKLTDAATIPPDYRDAFNSVDRAWFIPARMWVREDFSHGTDDDTDDDIAVDRDTDPELWVRAVYTDVPIVTQWDDGDTLWPDIGYMPTCSASAPSVVAAMLSTLDPQPGETVLEIGTGTGFNAALLSEIVGDTGRVVTVEVDPTLACDAATRLARYPNVEVITGDGGEPICGQWDRVIATVSVHVGRIPYWWAANTRPGGVLVAPMRADMTTGPLVRFVVGDDGTAIGHATPQRVGFMSLRAQRPTGGGFSRIPWDDPTADTTETALAPWVPLLDPEHCWPIALALPGCRFDAWPATDERPHGVALLSDPLTESWASVIPTDDEHRFTVRQHGPRRLWEAADTAYRWWQQHGQPPLSAWRWTITADRQSCTLD